MEERVEQYSGCISRGGMKMKNKRIAKNRMTKAVAFLVIIGSSFSIPYSVWANTASSPDEWIKMQQMIEQDSIPSETEPQTPQNGWIQEKEGFRYYLPDGTKIVSSLTLDGYYVDSNGLWNEKEFDILGIKVAAESKFCLPSSQNGWNTHLLELSDLDKKIQDAAGKNRVFHIYEDAITYCQVNEKEEKILLQLSKNKEKESYRFTISCDLGKKDQDLNKISTYDYSVFFYFCCKISHYPQELADAIYGNWQGNNSWGLALHGTTNVMDSQILCDIKNGAGLYTITALQ